MNTETRYDFGDFKLKYVCKFGIIDVDILETMFKDVETLIEKSLDRYDINLKTSINNGRIKKLEDLEDKLFNWLSLTDNYNINDKT